MIYPYYTESYLYFIFHQSIISYADVLKIFGRVPQTKLDLLGADHGQRTTQRHRARESIQFDGLDADVAP